MIGAPGSGSDAGSVTVEAAFAVGSLVVVLAVVLAAMGAVVLQLRCVDAATEAARLGARGDPDAARRAAARLLPDGAEVVLETRGDDVVARVRAAPLGSALPALRVGAEAVAAREPSPVAPVEGPDPLPGEPPEADAAASPALPESPVSPASASAVPTPPGGAR
ncbi:TadE family type IV pilus minor pilin [Actinomycetospora callitridis]|uniref:TadE family type IV pilus minor pilin n=1 Tax=Actinomycetospora callitridis TaxID=913944 RepID=UPI0023665105|nr:TadE family type IV pilus minor pilin [Actinomycetospora callitridis]MDD7920861.1 TadE family type IV pilus minor pilin [Actinomycetospora callitridis]